MPSLLATKMADKPEQVVDFLTDLAAKSLPQGEGGAGEIRAFAAEQHGQDELAAWDPPITQKSSNSTSFGLLMSSCVPYFPAGWS